MDATRSSECLHQLAIHDSEFEAELVAHLRLVMQQHWNETINTLRAVGSFDT